MQRRHLLGTAIALAAPKRLRAEAETTLKFVPQTDIAGHDPIWSSAQVTRNFAYLVYDTLFGVDAAYTPQPQMAEGALAEDDNRLWTVRLRPGLRFHDGEPVLARDCIASLRRWGKRDSFGQPLMDAVAELTAPDDRTLRFRMRRPFAMLPDALAKSTTNMPGIMPARLAATDAYSQVPEVVGSGPFRLVPEEGVSGVRIVFARNADYSPREDGPVGWTAGPKRVHFDRVEWRIIPDAATAAAALQKGEIDWWETPEPDYLPLLRRQRELTVAINDPSGGFPVLRMNWLHPPFDNPAIRRAVLAAVHQADFMTAIAGTDRALWRDGVGFFPPGTPCASEAGMAAIRQPQDAAAVRALLQAAGYRGERVVVLGATDRAAIKGVSDVAADLLVRIGMNVDFQVADWATTSARANRRDPPERGGWNLFFGVWSGLSIINPVVHQSLRGNGLQGWTGWPTAPRLEELRTAWLDATAPAERTTLSADIQREAFAQVPYVPLGQYFQPIAHRRDLQGIVTGFPMFWNVRRA